MLIKYNRPLSIDKHSIFEVNPHRLSQDRALQIPPHTDQIRHIVTMSNPRYILLDDGAVIQHGGRVMRGGSDQFHPALVSLMIGLAARECG